MVRFNSPVKTPRTVHDGKHFVSAKLIVSHNPRWFVDHVAVANPTLEFSPLHQSSLRLICVKTYYCYRRVETDGGKMKVYLARC